MGTCRRRTTASGPRFQRELLLLNAESKQIRSSLLHVEYVSNPPSLGERFRPLDGIQPNLSRSLLEMKTNLARYPNGDDLFFPLLQEVPGKHSIHLVMAMQFHKFFEASDSFQSHANTLQLFALT